MDQRFRRRAMGLRILTLGAAAILPLAAFGVYVALLRGQVPVPLGVPLHDGMAFRIGVAIYGLPIVAVVGAFLALARVLARFADGEVTTPDVARAMQRMALWMVLFFAIKVAVVPVASVLMTWHFPPGQRALTVAVDLTTLVALLAAGTLWLVASAIAEAARVAREYAEVV